MNIHVYLVFVLSCFVHSTIGAGSQLYATKHGQRSIGLVPLKSIAVSSITKCQILCQTTVNCTASNYGPINSADNGEHICELLNAQVNNYEALEHSQGWIYIEEHHACTKQPCVRGACNLVDCSFNCTCEGGFEGALCDVNIDECACSPCLNGGVCVDEINGFTCQCEEGYTGSNCQVNIDECASSPCVHGDCIDEINGFRCTCEDGYQGTVCDVNIDECASSPCLHGDCIDEVNGFRCTCDQGYQGTLCDASECDAILNGRCYNVYHDLKSWADARDTCMEDNGILAIVCDEETNEMLKSIMLNGWWSSMWLGGSNLASERRFDWVSIRCSFSTYTDWQNNEPNDLDRNYCLRMSYEPGEYLGGLMGWDDYQCLSQMPFVCEFESF